MLFLQVTLLQQIGSRSWHNSHSVTGISARKYTKHFISYSLWYLLSKIILKTCVNNKISLFLNMQEFYLCENDIKWTCTLVENSIRCAWIFLERVIWIERSLFNFLRISDKCLGPWESVLCGYWGVLEKQPGLVCRNTETSSHVHVSNYQIFKKKLIMNKTEIRTCCFSINTKRCDDKKEVEYLWLSIRHDDSVSYIKHISKDNKDHQKTRHLVVSPGCEVTTSYKDVCFSLVMSRYLYTAIYTPRWYIACYTP